MKKLFTLIAFLTCFLGANAKEVVDVELDFSTFSEVFEWSHGWIPSDDVRAYFDLQDGCFHFHSDEATTNNYDIQLQPFPGTNDTDAVYTVTVKIKGTVAQNIWFAFGGSDTPGNVPVTTDWQTLTFTDVVNKEDAAYFANSGHILLQCGSYVGDFWISYLKISHEEKEGKPINWVNMIENGDASAAWANPDAHVVSNAYDGEGAEGICAYGKEYGYNDNNPHAAFIEDGVFYTTTVPCPDVEDPACQWQNQFWINFPRALKDGEHLRLSFDYKASEAARGTGQGHRAPGDYLGGWGPGDVDFTTEWQTYTKEFDATADCHSIAFNLGVNGQHEKEITFYFDNIKLEYMDLKQGWFVAATDTEDGDPAYNFDEAQEFVEDGDVFVATVGTEGDQDSWVNQVMISTAYGNDKGFKAATIKVSGIIKNDPDNWPGFEAAGKSTIDLPVKGVWQISIDALSSQINFLKLEGEEDKEELEVIANATEVTLHGSAKTSQNWDNQFWIAANRDLKKGEKVLIEFDYWASEDDILVQSQAHGEGADGAPCSYIMHGLLGDFTFNTEPQHYSETVTIPDNADKMRSICFNMACVDQAVDYTIANVVWMTADKTERLVDPEDEGIFWLKTGEGNYVQYPAVPQPAGAEPQGADPDITGDGKINGTDIQALIMAIVEEEEDLEKYDINGDGKINGTDIQALINIIVEEE